MTSVVRARLLVEGNVQGVGYRAFVKQVARGLRIRGCARNLDEGGVEIYCETPSTGVLEAFKKRIELKGDAEDPFALHAASIAVFRENEKEFKPKPNTFRPFWVDYGGMLAIHQEMLEKAEIGGLLLQGVGKDIKGVGKDVQGVGRGVQDVGKNVQSLEKTLVGFKEQTVGNFSTLDSKYGTVSGSLNKINGNLEALNQTIKQIATKILRA